MAGFRSDAETKKWASLQHNAGASLQKIVQGTATASDFQRVSSVLNGLNTLAREVFDQAVSAAEVQAKKFESQYEKALDGLKADAKDLTPYERALNAALKQNNPDLVDAVHEAITLEIYEQSEDLKKDFGSRFDHIKDLLPPKDLPTVDDVLAAQDLLSERLSSMDDDKWKGRSSDLVDQIGQLFRDTLREVAEAVQRARSGTSSSPPRISASPRRLGYSGAAEILDAEPQHPMSRALSLVGGSAEDVDSNAIDMPSSTTAAANALPSRGEGAIQLSGKTEQVIQQAAEDQTSLYSQLSSFLKNPGAAGAGGSGGGAGAGSGQEQEENEQEKADTWWRSFRNWMGDKYDKAKDWNKENKGWLSGLGTLLSAMLLDPQLFENIGSMIGKYLTWDNVKKVAEASWHMMLDKGKDIVDWVQDKLGLNKPLTQKEVDDAKTDGGVKLSKNAAERLKDPKVQAAIAAQGDPFKDKNPNAKLPDNPSAGGHSSFMSKVSNLFGFTSGSSNPAVDQSVTNTNNSIANGGSATFNNRSTIVPKGDVGGPKTAAVPGNPASYTPGVTTQAPGTSSDVNIGPGTGDSRPTKGTAQIGLSSFKFHSATDDSLLMMNTSYFS